MGGAVVKIISAQKDENTVKKPNWCSRLQIQLVLYEFVNKEDVLEGHIEGAVPQAVPWYS